MKLYWPCAVRRKEDGTEEPVFTYDAVLSLPEARKQIANWKDWYHFKIIKCWVDEFENGEKLRTIHIHPEMETIICIDLHKNQN